MIYSRKCFHLNNYDIGYCLCETCEIYMCALCYTRSHEKHSVMFPNTCNDCHKFEYIFWFCNNEKCKSCLCHDCWWSHDQSHNLNISYVKNKL